MERGWQQYENSCKIGKSTLVALALQGSNASISSMGDVTPPNLRKKPSLSRLTDTILNHTRRRHKQVQTPQQLPLLLQT